MKLKEYLMYLNIFRDSQCIKVFGSELVVNIKQTKEMKNGGEGRVGTGCSKKVIKVHQMVIMWITAKP